MNNNQSTFDLRERLFSMDLLRVIACYMVIQIHAGEFYYIGNKGAVLNGENAEWVNILNSLFRICVPLFVLITGYFVLPVKEKMGIFLKKRLTRVVIPFIIWCTLYAFYQFFEGKFTLNETFINIVNIPLNYGVQVGHLWYIYMLIGLYLFFPIISPWLNIASRQNLHFYLIIWVVTLFIPYIHLLVPSIWGECFWNNTPMLNYFTGFLGYVILGFYLKKFCSEKSKWDLPLGIILIIVGYIITTVIFTDLLKTTQWVWELELSWGYTTINVAMMTMGTVLLIKNIKCSNTSIKAVVSDISNMSYGMYLAHIMILNIFYWIFNDMFSSALVKIPLIALCTFAASYLVIKLISHIPKSKYLIG